MHENKLIHTDIKPENIVFNNSYYRQVFNQKEVDKIILLTFEWLTYR